MFSNSKYQNTFLCSVCLQLTSFWIYIYLINLFIWISKIKMSKLEKMVPRFQDIRVAVYCKLGKWSDRHYCQFHVSVFFAHCVLQLSHSGILQTGCETQQAMEIEVKLYVTVQAYALVNFWILAKGLLPSKDHNSVVITSYLWVRGFKSRPKSLQCIWRLSFCWISSSKCQRS
jgi:hypothetical protein